MADQTTIEIVNRTVTVIGTVPIGPRGIDGTGGGGGGAAVDITFDPAGNIVADDVQAALEELDAEKQSAAQVTTAIGVAVTALKNGAPAGGDTLGELDARLAVIEALGSLATDAELIAAIVALLGSADTAGDTLGELQSLIGLRLLKSANLSDLANVATARTNLDVYSKAAVDALIAALSGTYDPLGAAAAAQAAAATDATTKANAAQVAATSAAATDATTKANAAQAAAISAAATDATTKANAAQSAAATDATTKATAAQASAIAASQPASGDLTDLVARWVPASAAGPASLDFAEDTDNGTNRARLIAPALLASDFDLTLPSGAGTLARTSDIPIDKIGLTPTTVKTGNYTAAAGEMVRANTSGGAFAITFPTAPADGTAIGVKLTTAGNTLSLTLGGSDKFNLPAGSGSGSLSYANQAILCIYSAADATWVVIADDLPKSVLDTLYIPKASQYYADDVGNALQGMHPCGPAGGGSNYAPGANTMILWPLMALENCTIDGGGFQVGVPGAVGTKARFGIYPASAGMPGNGLLLDSGEVDIASTGWKTATWTALALTAFTPYWAFMFANDATFAWRWLANAHSNNTPSGLPVGSNPASGVVYVCRTATQTYGAAPSNPPSSALTGSKNPPCVIWKVRR